MNPERRHYLEDLHRQGAEHDATVADRTGRRRNLDPDTAAFVSMQLKLMNARTVVEIGTSNGYSTIWLADALESTGGSLIIVDTAEQDDAMVHVDNTGLGARVTFRRADGAEVLKELGDGSVDVLFLDAERTQYAGWWPYPISVLRAGGLLLIDNAHRPAPEELADILKLMATEPELEHFVLGVGSGLVMARTPG